MDDSTSTFAALEDAIEPKFPEKVRVFVIMPYGSAGEYEGEVEEADYIYNEIIRPGVKDAFENASCEVDIRREVDKSESGSITASILHSLLRADVVIADVTGRNPNVFYELGVRHSLRCKVTVLLTQEPRQIPFDIQGYRFLSYRRFSPRSARKELAKFVRRGFTDTPKSDSVVFDVFDNMSVVIPNVLTSHGPKSPDNRETMLWEDFMNRIEWTIQMLKRSQQDGRYTFDALVGISNGGLIATDIIGREVFFEKPILALWANRRTSNRESTYRFFDNAYNHNVCDALAHETAAHRHQDPVRLVLVDDHFGSGTTALQARAFLTEKLGANTRIAYFPMVTRRVAYLQVVEDMLPYKYEDPPDHKVFPITKDEFERVIQTNASYFPYLKKDIVGE